VDEIVKISGHFGQDSSRVIGELRAEIERDGVVALLDHLRLCGAMPEHFGHDSSEEKLYSKYTDALLSEALSHLGFNSAVLSERADAADVEAAGPEYGLVADAKVFRLSRTAKNQKDFKIEALHGWKRGWPFALVVCPIYQVPSRASQIYQQAIARAVCIFSYSHLAVVVRLARELGPESARDLLRDVLRCSEVMNPTKDAVYYWMAVNRTMLSHADAVHELWAQERIAAVESIDIAKTEALTSLAAERRFLMSLTHEEAIQRLVGDRNIEGRIRVITAVTDNGILSIA